MKNANHIDRLLVLAHIQHIEVTAHKVLHLLNHLTDVLQVVLVILILHNGRGLTSQRSILLHGSNDVVSERQIQLDCRCQAILRLLFRSARNNLDQVERVPRTEGECVVSIWNLYLSNSDECQTFQNEEASTDVRVVAPQINGRNATSIVPSSQRP